MLKYQLELEKITMETLTMKSYDERLAEMKDKLIRTKSTVCTERAKIYTKIYRLYERKPIIIRRASYIKF
jgi:hypothetical protein